MLRPDAAAIAARRRAKSATELAGIRRAQAAAEAGMSAAAALLRQAVVDGDRLTLELVCDNAMPFTLAGWAPDIEIVE